MKETSKLYISKDTSSNSNS